PPTQGERQGGTVGTAHARLDVGDARAARGGGVVKLDARGRRLRAALNAWWKTRLKRREPPMDHYLPAARPKSKQRVKGPTACPSVCEPPIVMSQLRASLWWASRRAPPARSACSFTPIERFAAKLAV